MSIERSADRQVIATLVDEAITAQASDGDVGLTLRDGAIENAMRQRPPEMIEQVDAVLSSLTDDFGRRILDDLQSDDPRTRHSALNLLGGIVSELAGNVSDNLFQAPAKPPDSAMCIRYLTPEKWLWLQHQRSIRFSEPSTFHTDRYDSVTPNAVLREFISALYQRPEFSGITIEWIPYAVGHWLQEEGITRARYRTSCWNIFDEHTSHLMWHQLAGGRSGIAITCKYGVLRDAIDYFLTDGTHSDIEWMPSGLVHYQTTSLVKPPYFKRPEYADEREVRFVAHVLEGNEVALPLSLIVRHLKVIAPPDAQKHHQEAIEASWNALRARTPQDEDFGAA